MVARARAGLAPKQEPGTRSFLQVSHKDMGHPPPLFQSYLEGAGSEVEQPGL